MTPIPTIVIFSAYPDDYRIAVNVMEIETVREHTSGEKATIRTKSGDVFSVMDSFERIMSKLRGEEK